VLKEARQEKTQQQPIIPTPVLEMTKMHGSTTETVITGNNCGASVSVNTSINDGPADNHFLLRKFLKEDSQLQDAIPDYNRIFSVILEDHHGPEPILLDVKREDQVHSPQEYCQLGQGNQESNANFGASPFGAGSSTYDDVFSPSSSTTSSGIGKSPVYTIQHTPQSAHGEEDTFEPLASIASIAMDQLKTEVETARQSLCLSSG
jgi:hypothetical protein